MRRFFVMLVVVALLEFPALVQATEVPLGEDWYVVTEGVYGYDLRMEGDKLVLTGKGGTFRQRDEPVPVARVLGQVTQLGNELKFGDQPFAYPANPGFLRLLLGRAGHIVDLDPLPPATPQARGLDRQPILTEGEEEPGTLARHPRINLVRRLLAEGYELTSAQIDYLNDLDGKGVPGNLYLTVFLAPPVKDDGLWVVTSWVYLFEPSLQEILKQVAYVEPSSPLPPLPPPSPSEKSNWSSSEVLILPEDCRTNPDATDPEPCLNYPDLVTGWYCEQESRDRRCNSN